MRKNIAVLLLTIVFVLALAGSALAWTQKDVDEIKHKAVDTSGEPLDVSPIPGVNSFDTGPNPYDKLPEEWAVDPNSEYYKSKDLTVVIKREKIVKFPDQQPYIDENGRTLVPVRFVAQELGCQVDWNNEESLVTIERQGTEIKLKVGESKALVNGEPKTFDTKAVLTDKGRVMVPLRFISETLGAVVQWEERAWIVRIWPEGLDTDEYRAFLEEREWIRRSFESF